ncbi:FAD-dependent oxidoreductase [Gimesia aquarii]|uniref:Putative FAD-binding dehydrogenase n=1 Tax=Gimesia aquarii TaxID=2527964 RepID=A0A517W097_9PLAN|nr:FAD-dependent oxidoreductase [Gimesia aquarii]QDT98679.1 putative FAD-binding dehydrogenase [Gimesia aquarii]
MAFNSIVKFKGNKNEVTLLQEHTLNCEILVAGGGMAGCCCAIAAARCGAKVILCQDRSVLGGNASSEIRMHIVGANGTGGFDRGVELETEAREGGIIEELRLENCVRNPQRSASMFDLILFEKCKAEPNLTLLLNTAVTAVTLNGDQIEHAIAERQSTEDRFTINAEIFIDCTGDGRLAAEAGALFIEGREGRQQFNESLAPETPDNHRLGSTILLQARRHNRPMPFIAPEWVRKFEQDELKRRLYATPGEEQPTHEYGYWWAEWGGVLDTIKQNEEIRDELLAVVMGIWDHVKNGPPGTPAGDDPFEAAHWALDWFGFLPGKRESRRFIGQHILTEQDLLTSRDFPDAIAFGGWSLDLHPPEGIDAPDLEPCTQHPVPSLYNVPLSACISKNRTNLMFAGRNISATHVAFSSTRVMATCAVIGQGVGTAAAFAVQQKLPPAELISNQGVMAQVQQQLLRDDSYLVGIQIQDHNDLARAACISASSERVGYEAANVVSGQTRCVHGAAGAPEGRANPGGHRWMSDPKAGLPATLQLEWDVPIQPSEIQLIFDTGLHRHLTLSHHDGYTSKMQWGAPQAETVRDYRIEVFDGKTWFLLAEVEGNFQRRRVHTVERTSSLSAIRVVVTASNGVDHARICEVRVY